MRITEKEKSSIKKIFNQFFKGGEIYLFGSRVDNTKKGGDIDLYIVPQEKINQQALFQNKIDFLTKLKVQIGDQKIDLVVATDPLRSIEKIAQKTGILL